MQIFLGFLSSRKMLFFLQNKWNIIPHCEEVNSLELNDLSLILGLLAILLSIATWIMRHK